VLVTGAAGGIGTMLRERLPQYGHELRLLDAAPVPGAPGAVTAPLADEAALRAAVRGTDAVLHLAGISLEAPFEEILRANIEGTWRLYEAVRAERVPRVVYASSVHAVGFTPLPHGGPVIRVDVPHRPDTYYGLSKCFGEDLAQLYWDRHGVETVSVRIGSCHGVPPATAGELPVWLSAGDCARLLHAALTAPGVGHTTVYGSSANTRAVWDLAPARALGYAPEDDSEVYAAGLGAQPDRSPGRDLLGGDFTAPTPPTRHSGGGAGDTADAADVGDVGAAG
jgi:uronate dehydrogenase